MSSNKDQLREKLDKIGGIFLSAKEHFIICKYLYNPDTERERKYLNNSNFFSLVSHAFWRLSIIELSKLINESSSEKFNVHRLIARFKKDNDLAKLGLDESLVKEWENSFSENKGIIEVVLNLRHKLYAHTDPKGEEYAKAELYFSDVEKLMDIIKDILDKIYSSIFDEGLHFVPLVPDSETSSLVRLIVEAKEEKLKFFLKQNGFFSE